MKRLLSALFAVIAVCAFIPFGSACQTTDPTTNTFRIMDKRPWETPTGYERMTYEYTRTVPSTGAIEERGTVVMEITSGIETTEIRITESVFDAATGKTVFESSSSAVVATVGFHPRSSSKTVKLYNVDESADFIDSSYSVTADYQNKTSTGSIAGVEKTPIALPDIGVSSYDNEQGFYLVRAATNLETLENTGTFGLANMADTYFSGEFYKHEMIYTVEATETLDASKFTSAANFGVGDKIPCFKVNFKINSTKSGPGTVLYYSDQPFTVGEETVSDRVLMKIVREQYNVNTFVQTYLHEYVLTDYSINK